LESCFGLVGFFVPCIAMFDSQLCSLISPQKTLNNLVEIYPYAKEIRLKHKRSRCTGYPPFRRAIRLRF